MSWKVGRDGKERGVARQRRRGRVSRVLREWHAAGPAALAADEFMYKRIRMGRPAHYRRRLLVLALLVTMAAGVRAEDGRRTVRKDPFVHDQYNVYEDGHRTGTVRPNPFVKGQLDVRDEHGRVRETVRPDPFVKGQYDIDADGRRTGTIRPDPFVKDRYDLRDERGQPQGTIRKNPFVRDQWDVETRE